MLAWAAASHRMKASTTIDLGTAVFLSLHDVIFGKRGFGRSYGSERDSFCFALLLIVDSLVQHVGR